MRRSQRRAMNTEIVSSLEIAASRADEIEYFSNNLTNKENAKVQSTFPKHLRRRAASHNPKRVPQRLREKYLVKTKATENITKRPSRRYRRRPKNLLIEYNRRQRRHAWLETHIWHAKRFQMVEKWGYKLPEKPQEKSFRACYRASRRQCLMQDISFLQCIQIQGPEEFIIERLNRLTHPSTGLSFSSKASLSGVREGNAVVYSQGCYPNGVIGQVYFMWRPVKESGERTIWIWVHPSIYQNFLQELSNSFEVRKVERGQMEAEKGINEDRKEGEELMETVYSDLENIGMNETGCELDPEGLNETEKDQTENIVHKKEKKKRRNVDLEKLASRNVPYERTPMWENDLIKIVELKGTLNRFSLRGPVSQKILSEVLKVAVIDKDSELTIPEEEKPPSFSKWANFEKDFSREGAPTIETEYILEDLESRLWWKKEFTDPFKRKVFFKQKKFWESIEDVLPGQCSPRMILGLTVLDPRPFLPPKRQLHRPSAAIYQEKSRKDDLPYSFLWDEKVRDCVSLSKISDNILNRQRGSLKLGENLVLGEAGSKIPVILIQQPGVQGRNGKDTSMGTGWDLILPANWGMAFWLALVYNGARVGGLREERMLRFECCLPEGNLLNVDSVAGKLELETQKEFLTKEFFKRPPNNRSNLIKLGVHWAFEPPLEQLVSEWNNSNSSYYVLRDRSALMKIEKVLSKVVLTAKKEHNSKLRITGAKSSPNFSQDTLNLNLEIDSGTHEALASKSSIAPEKNKITKSDTACDILNDSHTDVTLSLVPEELSSLLSSLNSALIPVKVSMLNRGSPEGYTSLCLPSREDIAKLEEGNFFGPIEPLKEDRDEKKRHELKKEHQKELRGLKRKRKHLKNEMFLQKVKRLNSLFSNEQVQNEDRSGESMTIELSKYKSQEKSDQYNAKIREIWLPKSRSVRHCNSREIIGFGLTGGFSYSESKGEALGYIVACSVERLLACQGYVLVREAHSQQYRFAALSVLL